MDAVEQGCRRYIEVELECLLGLSTAATLVGNTVAVVVDASRHLPLYNHDGDGVGYWIAGDDGSLAENLCYFGLLQEAPRSLHSSTVEAVAEVGMPICWLQVWQHIPAQGQSPSKRVHEDSRLYIQLPR